MSELFNANVSDNGVNEAVVYIEGLLPDAGSVVIKLLSKKVIDTK